MDAGSVMIGSMSAGQQQSLQTQSDPTASREQVLADIALLQEVVFNRVRREMENDGITMPSAAWIRDKDGEMFWCDRLPDASEYTFAVQTDYLTRQVGSATTRGELRASVFCIQARMQQASGGHADLLHITVRHAAYHNYHPLMFHVTYEQTLDGDWIFGDVVSEQQAELYPEDSVQVLQEPQQRAADAGSSNSEAAASDPEASRETEEAEGGPPVYSAAYPLRPAAAYYSVTSLLAAAYLSVNPVTPAPAWLIAIGCLTLGILLWRHDPASEPQALPYIKWCSAATALTVLLGFIE